MDIHKFAKKYLRGDRVHDDFLKVVNEDDFLEALEKYARLENLEAKKLLRLAKRSLKSLKKDAEMAISGEWDISGMGLPINNEIAEGFEASISVADDALIPIKKYLKSK